MFHIGHIETYFICKLMRKTTHHREIQVFIVVIRSSYGKAYRCGVQIGALSFLYPKNRLSSV